jgi:hypothetical protein
VPIVVKSLERILPISLVTIFDVTLQVMSSIMSSVNDIINYMSHRKNAITCAGKDGLRSFMKELGFDDTEGDTKGHRIFTHPRLSGVSEFISTSVDCGHRLTRNMKMPYVVKMIGVLKKYKSHLEEFEEQDNEKC